MNIREYVLLLCLLCNMQVVCAQYAFHGTVQDRKGSIIDGAQVLLSQKDSIVGMALTDKKGHFQIKDLQSGEYLLNISFLGYTTLDEKMFIRKADTKATYTLLPEITGELGEVVVKGVRNESMKQTATGQTYFLSDAAKNSGNPFTALSEIPRIIANEAFQTIKLQDGSQPLILIDGNRMNSGVAPIDPKEIESVEIVDVVSARYLRNNIKHIINIKLKKKIKPYTFLQVMNRHNIPLLRGMGAVYFEVGNQKYSLYGRSAVDYIYDDDMETESRQENEGYQKSLSGIQRNNKRSQLAELQFRWMMTPKDYMVAHIYEKGDVDKSRTWGSGLLTTDAAKALDYTSNARDFSSIWTGTLYHKHSFTKNNILETTLAYNRNINRKNSFREESYPDWLYHNNYNYDNSRSSLNMNVDYSLTWNEINSLNIGSATDYIHDRIDLVSGNDPVFFHRKWNEYLYASFSSQIHKKLLYMASVGYEGIWLKAADVAHHYFKPRAALSASYLFNDRHSVEMSYTLSNEAPAVSTLNPYNTSSDSLVITKGNPYLLPTTNHSMITTYNFNHKRWHFSSEVQYKIFTDRITDYGYSHNSIYTNTYTNSGVFRQLNWGGFASYRLNKGRAYVYFERQYDYYSGQKAKKSVSIGTGINKRYGKWQLSAELEYTDYAYSSTSRTKQIIPDYTLMQVIYNFTKDFYISAAVENVFGAPRSETVSADGSYHGYSFTRNKDRAFLPWVLIRYTFRKNSDHRIKEDKLMNSSEKGIKL